MSLCNFCGNNKLLIPGVLLVSTRLTVRSGLGVAAALAVTLRVAAAATLGVLGAF